MKLIPGGVIQAPSGELMKIVGVADDIAELLFIDEDGGLHLAHMHLNAIRSVHDLMQAKSLWPAIGHIDEIELAAEESRARAERKAKAKKAQKPKASKKLKRKRK